MPLPDHLRRLLADCDVETYRSSGPGGQKKNKTESSVRVRHRPSGLARVATESRSQHRNREAALERLWAALQARARRAKPRVPTTPGRAAQARRLAEKRLVGERKRRRERPRDEE